jgi:hypothetical protein
MKANKPKGDDTPVIDEREAKDKECLDRPDSLEQRLNGLHASLRSIEKLHKNS